MDIETCGTLDFIFFWEQLNLHKEYLPYQLKAQSGFAYYQWNINRGTTARIDAQAPQS